MSVSRWAFMRHRIHRPDAERHLHDHPWPFATLILRGGYDEEFLPSYEAHLAGAQPVRRSWRPGSVHRMPLRVGHRIASVRPGTTTLVLVGRKTCRRVRSA